MELQYFLHSKINIGQVAPNQGGRLFHWKFLKLLKCHHIHELCLHVMIELFQ